MKKERSGETNVPLATASDRRRRSQPTGHGCGNPGRSANFHERLIVLVIRNHTECEGILVADEVERRGRRFVIDSSRPMHSNTLNVGENPLCENSSSQILDSKRFIFTWTRLTRVYRNKSTIISSSCTIRSPRLVFYSASELLTRDE